MLAATLKGATASVSYEIIPQHNVLEGKITNYSLQATNNFNYTVYNVSFTNTESISFNPIPSIPPNQAVDAYYSILANDRFERIEQSTATFDYFTTQGVNVQSHDVIVTHSGFNPPVINIVDGDTIVFKTSNTTGNYSVSDLSNTWSGTFDYNSPFSRTFSGVGTHQVFNTQSGFILNVSASQSTSQTITHNSAYDRLLNFNIASVHEESQWLVNFLTVRYEMNYSEVRNGAIFFEVMNTGNPVYDVHLTAEPDWISFDENDFSVEDNKVVGYKLKPRIDNTSQTGINHTITITVSPSNANLVSKNLTVEITKEDSVDETLAGLPANFVFITEAQLIAFCEKMPESCPHTYIEKIVERNITTNETLEIRKLYSFTERFYNKVAGFETSLTTLQEKVDGLSGEVKVLQKQNNELQEKVDTQSKTKTGTTIFFIVLGSIIVLAGLIFLLVKFLIAWRNRRLLG